MVQKYFIISIVLIIGVLAMGAPFVNAEEYHQVRYEEHVSQIDTLAKQSAKKPKKMPQGIVGGIAPHHVPTAFPLIVDFYAQLKYKEKIKTIVVLGPDHFNKNNVDITVSEKKFVTPYGVVNSNIKIIHALQQTGLVSVDEKPFKKEHSILSHAIVIKKVLPHTKLVPLVFRASTTFEQAKKLGEYFAQYFDDSVLVVVSVDFSHYLPLKQARERDEKSLSFVRSANPETLSYIDVDSPAALATLFFYLKKKNAQQGAHLDTWNMADFEQVTDNTTGYITGYFRKKDIKPDLSFPRRRESSKKYIISSYLDSSPKVLGLDPGIPDQVEDDILQERNKQIRLLFAGDIMLSRHIETIMKKKKDFAYHTKKIKKFMRSGDLTIANFENPIRGTKNVKKGDMVFGADPKSIATLESLGIDIVSLANNHMADQGGGEIKRTLEVLEKSSIAGVGTGNTYDQAHTPVIKEVKGIKIAFLAYTPFLSKYIKKKSSKPAVSDMNKEEIIRDVKRAKNEADIVVTMFHWGDEYKTKHNKKQEEVAHAAIDAGASLVIGHHPHVIQDIETYKDAPIIYSLGNFIFDQNFSKDTKRGLVAEIRINKDKTLSLIPHEVRFTKDFQPYIVNE